jgi:hypothetical protein
MPSRLKRGRLGNVEMAYIRKHVQEKGVEEVGRYLNRDPLMIREWVKKNMAIDIGEQGETVTLEEAAIRNEFRNTVEYKQLKEEFLDKEVEFFEHRYAKLVSQFKGDMLPSEETQLFLLIKYEILINRNLKDRRRALTDIEDLEKKVENLYAQEDELTQHEKDRIKNMETQINAARNAIDVKNSEFDKLTARHSAISKELKMTRDQRLSKIENSKQSLMDMIKSLQEERVRKAMGDDAELMVVAEDIERRRLGREYVFADGVADRPLLSADTVNYKEEDDVPSAE